MADTRIRRSGVDSFNKQFLARQRLLVVAPHADDETAGAGGLMARVKDAGGKVFVMVMSTGDLLHFDDTGKKTKKKTRPTMIVLPAPSYNQDHEAVYKAGLAACRPHLHTVKSFQQFVLVADAPQLSWSRATIFKPNFYVDISGKYLDLKLKAYACHKSQVRPEPSQAGIGAIRLMAESRGREISVEAAEAFECHRFVL